MEIFISFTGRAQALAELYEGVAATSFLVRDPAARNATGLVVPNTGDRVRLRMHPGPDIREYRCTGRLFDFSEAASPLLTLKLDMP